MRKPTELDIGFIGSGQMARALAGGMVANAIASGNRIRFHDPSIGARQGFQNQLAQAVECQSNSEVVRESDLIFIAVKPHIISQIADDVRSGLKKEALIVSIAAGVGLEKLSDLLKTRRLVRVMPNTPCLVGRGAAALARLDAVSDEETERILELMRAVGVCYEVHEPLLDVVTGLSGSGPAYVFLVIDALIEGGVRSGLPRDIARSLAIETVAGATELLQQSDTHPAELANRVTSPGGTTAAGLFELENGRTRAVIMSAVDAATRKARELGSLPIDD